MSTNRLKELEQQARLLEMAPSKEPSIVDDIVEFTDQWIQSLPKEKSFYRDEDLKNLKGLKGFSEEGEGLAALLSEFNEEVLVPGINGGSGGHMGYIPGGGIYASALSDYLAAATNKYVGVYYAAPGAVKLENQLIKWMCNLVGLPESTSGGNLTSGGSMASLIAMVAARELSRVKAKDFERCAIYYTQHAHHSSTKAIINAGLKEAKIRHVPMDEKFRMKPLELQKMIEEDKERGLIPLMIMASAGTTDVGAVDPLDAIGEIANAHNIWYNVDAAYGGFFTLTEYGKKKLKGIEKADSVVIDSHKGLFLPFGSGAILVRDQKQLYNSQHLPANYMQDTMSNQGELSPADLSPELTKHFRGVRMWLPLRLLGIKPFRAALEEKLELARYFYQEVQKIPAIKVGPDPELSVFYFHFQPDGRDANLVTKQLLDEIHKDGRVFLSSTTIEGTFYIRVAILCFRTHLEHVQLALDIIREITSRITKSR